MADYTATRSTFPTLEATVVSTVTIRQVTEGITVINLTGATSVYYTVGYKDRLPPDPAVEGDNTFVLPAVIGAAGFHGPDETDGVVKVVSSGTPTVGVVGG